MQYVGDNTLFDERTRQFIDSRDDYELGRRTSKIRPDAVAHILDFLPRGKPGRIGAYVGIGYGDSLLREYADGREVLIFEPSDRLIELNERTHRACDSSSDLCFFHVACGPSESKGKVEFIERPTAMVCSSVADLSSDLEEPEDLDRAVLNVHQVSISPIDALVDGLTASRIDRLVVDVEVGSDMVLEGARQALLSMHGAIVVVEVTAPLKIDVVRDCHFRPYVVQMDRLDTAGDGWFRPQYDTISATAKASLAKPVYLVYVNGDRQGWEA